MRAWQLVAWLGSVVVGEGRDREERREIQVSLRDDAQQLLTRIENDLRWLRQSSSRHSTIEQLQQVVDVLQEIMRRLPSDR